MNDILKSTKPDINALPGGWEPKTDIKLSQGHGPDYRTNNGLITIIECGLTKSDCSQLISLMDTSSNFQKVSVQGNMNDVNDYGIGSIRTTAWSPELAEQLNATFKNCISDLHANDKTPTDWWQGNKDRRDWEFFGVSPLLRFMKYQKGSKHFSHYDAGFIYPDDNYRTLMSFVIYLTTNSDGHTRFINDNQENISIWDRNHMDWARESMDCEVYFESKPIAGNILVFPHRLCHDVEQYTGDGARIIIRGDLIFKAIK